MTGQLQKTIGDQYKLISTSYASFSSQTDINIFLLEYI